MNIQVKNLCKNYKQGASLVEAVSDISFHLNQENTVAITGQSGSGKTTLLSLLAGLDEVTSGQILIQNSDITSMSEKELGVFRSRQLGIVFQQFHLLPHLTALENISLALEIAGSNDVLNKAQDALDKVGLAKRAKHFPSELSGGENQRVAIARAIVNQPILILADEPSGNLDTETGQKVMDLIFNLTEENNMSLVLVTHDKSLASRCKKHLVLKNGKLQ